MSESGRFISIEGTDGAGKGTQTEKLAELLTGRGFDVETIAFPRYHTETGKKVSEYLNLSPEEGGQFGPKEASELYIADRKAAMPEINSWLARGAIVLADRFSDSNRAHQGAKISNIFMRHGFYEWITEREEKEEGIRAPDFTAFLKVDPTVAQSQVDKKSKREYTEKKRDLHEDDDSHLRRAYRSYLEIAHLYPDRIRIVNCMDYETGEIKSIERITHELGGMVLRYLSSRQAS